MIVTEIVVVLAAALVFPGPPQPVGQSPPGNGAPPATLLQRQVSASTNSQSGGQRPNLAPQIVANYLAHNPPTHAGVNFAKFAGVPMLQQQRQPTAGSYGRLSWYQGAGTQSTGTTGSGTQGSGTQGAGTAVLGTQGTAVLGTPNAAAAPPWAGSTFTAVTGGSFGNLVPTGSVHAYGEIPGGRLTNTMNFHERHPLGANVGQPYSTRGSAVFNSWNAGYDRVPHVGYDRVPSERRASLRSSQASLGGTQHLNPTVLKLDASSRALQKSAAVLQHLVTTRQGQLNRLQAEHGRAASKDLKRRIKKLNGELKTFKKQIRTRENQTIKNNKAAAKIRRKK